MTCPRKCVIVRKTGEAFPIESRAGQAARMLFATEQKERTKQPFSAGMNDRQGSACVSDDVRHLRTHRTRARVHTILCGFSSFCYNCKEENAPLFGT